MPGEAASRFKELLDPVDRVGEVLFGLIMVLTSTTTLSVATAGKAEVKTMILGALGCNLAWGIIDGGMYLLGCLGDRVRGPMLLGALRATQTPEAGNRVILDALPPELAAALPASDIDAIRRSLVQAPAVVVSPALTRDDMLGAVAVCFWVFLSTFPVVIPFFFFNETQPALRASNAVAIAMLFGCGYVFAKSIGGKPWITGAVMVMVGAALVAVAVALGG